MIKEVTGVEILTNKGHQVYKPKKGHVDHLLKIGSHAPATPLKDHIKLHLAPKVHLHLMVLQATVVLLLVPQRRKAF
jgi:hypothetical protein